MSTSEYDELENAEKPYNRCNSIQVYKVREYVRKSEYLLESKTGSKDHVSIDGKTTLCTDLVHFSTIAVDNITHYVKKRIHHTDVVIKPVYLTEDESLQANSICNFTINELIFQIIEMLDAETSKLREEVFKRTIHNKKKDVHIEFYYKLCDVLDGKSKNEEIIPDDNE